MRNTAVAPSRYKRFIPNTGFITKTASIPASVGGWDTISGLAQMPEDRAVQMDNWIPRTGYLEIRRGFIEHSDTGTAEPVETLMAYNGIGTEELFAASDDKIWDVTASGAGVDTGVTLTDNRLQYTNFTNESSAQNYLVCANGVDDPKIYDGSTWANMTITIPTYSDSDVVQPHAHQGRLWLVLAQSNEVAYLPLGAIAGTATIFPLGSFMSMGGYIMAMASWSVDTRQTVNDYAVFITSRGQAIVFMGNDPDTNFALVGVYNFGPPIGRRCYREVVGDVFLLTLDGIIPMSSVVQTDRAASRRVSLSREIDGAFAIASSQYSSLFGWQIIQYPKGSLAIVNVPQVENQQAIQFVMNVTTGAWCRFVGINANCWETLASNNTIYFGGNDGVVYQWDTGSGDGDEAITATIQTAFNYHGDKGRLKNWTLIRPIITSDGSIIPGVGLNIDFGSGAFVSTPTAIDNMSAQWDESLWDTATWPQEGLTSATWQSVSGTGQCASVITEVQTLPNGTANGVLLQLNGWTMSYEMGGLI